LQEIDHKQSRTLVIPFLKDVGVVQLGRSGAFIEVGGGRDCRMQLDKDRNSSSSSGSSILLYPFADFAYDESFVGIYYDARCTAAVCKNIEGWTKGSKE
jgi:hypothetical protein